MPAPPRFPPSPHRVLDDGPRYGTEVWRSVRGVVFHHWDRWLLRLSLDEPQGLESIKQRLRSSVDRPGRFGDDEEALLAQVVDLQRRLTELGVAPGDVLDEQERASDWLLKKAHRRVWHDGPHTRTEAMRRTPKRVLEERSHRGFWPGFPVSPSLFEGRLTNPFDLELFRGRSSLPISTTSIDFSLKQLGPNASDAERLAMHRAALALILDGMEHAYDEAWDEQVLYREVEEAYLSLLKPFLMVPAVLHDLIALVTWEDYGLTKLAPRFLAQLSRDEANLALSLLEQDLAELREAGLRYQTGRAEGLRKTILASHPDLAPRALATPSPAPLRPAPVANAPSQRNQATTTPARRRAPLPRVTAGSTSATRPPSPPVALPVLPAGIVDDAVERLWRGFVRAPSVETFRSLRRRASKLPDWPRLRQQALDHARVSIADPAESANTMIEILLLEKRPQDALTEARARPCRPHLWALLAGALAEDHPLDAIEIYRDYLFNKLRTSRQARGFEVAAAPLRKLAKSTAGTEAEPVFRELIAWLREELGGCRGFIEFLREEGL